MCALLWRTLFVGWLRPQPRPNCPPSLPPRCSEFLPAAKALLAAGADPLAPNAAGDSPVALAVRSGLAELEQLFGVQVRVGVVPVSLGSQLPGASRS